MILQARSAEERRRRVVSLCEEMVVFMDEIEQPDAKPFYENAAAELRVASSAEDIGRLYRCIYQSSNSGAGGLGDQYILHRDGSADVPRTEQYYECLAALLRATRRLLWRI